jgi:predicted Zn-dependent protease
MRASRLPLLFALALTLWAASRRAGDPPRPGLNFFTKDQDVQLGREAAEEIRQKVHVTQNRFLQDYVAHIGRRLSRQPEAAATNFNFEFTLIDESAVNAFALPGGPMFIDTGLLKSADSEAEIAGVMGHEMAHIILRHGTNQLSKQNLLAIPAILAETVIGNGSLFAALTRGLIGVGLNSALLSYSRENESEADLLGARLAAEAGYDPRDLASFFAKLKKANGGARGESRLAQFLSDHPSPGNREVAIEEEARAMQPNHYGFSTGQFVRAKRELKQLAR